MVAVFLWIMLAIFWPYVFVFGMWMASKYYKNKNNIISLEEVNSRI